MSIKQDSRLGETNVATNGMKMQIIAYHNTNNVDIQFENGEIIKGRSYQSFKKGQIRSKLVKNIVKEGSRLGETSVATNGMKMKIIAYHNANNVDIQFENGEIIKGRSYQSFKKGQIRSKLVKSDNGLIKKQRLGEETVSNSGMKMKIIAYRSAQDIDVQFEDGTVIKHRWYRRFQTGAIKNPNYYRNNRVGEKSIAKCGMEMTIIAYRSTTDIDVLFEDGAVVYNKTYSDFKIGYICHPHKKQRLGEKSMANCGMEMTIIAYRNCKDIDIQFEDGVVVYNKTYYYFKTGQIGHPDICS